MIQCSKVYKVGRSEFHPVRILNPVTYNENTQLNDVIKTKDNLINEQGIRRISLAGFDKIVKDNSFILNVESTNTINGKLKLVLPILFLLIFILIHFFIAFYRKQSVKANLSN